MKKNVVEQKDIEQEEIRKQILFTYLSNKWTKFQYKIDAKKLLKKYEDQLEAEKNLKISKISLQNKKEIPLPNNSLSKIKEINLEKPLTKTEINGLKNQLTPKNKQKIIESYDHSQPQISSKSSWDYRKLRSRTLKAMKKKEKLAIENQKNSLVKEIFEEIYNEKWKKYIQFNSKNNVIDMREICKYFVNGTNVEYILKKINITIKQGEIYVILGASGSGKTTLLNIISGLIDASSGDVIVQNRNLFLMDERNKIKFRADNVSFVFQSYNLIPSLTVEENIKVGASLRSKNTEKVSVKEIMKLLKLYEQRNKYPFQLSGGQNQRVSIGRALSKNPKILFADEPTGALDEERGKEALQFLVDINEKYGTTIIMVTHNPNFKWVGDTTLKIHDGEVETLSHNKKRIKPQDIKWT